tara:strand:- start:402 stop:626 length:225 start_codon:yes stop_codon:yes gene_type:complete
MIVSLILTRQAGIEMKKKKIIDMSVPISKIHEEAQKVVYRDTPVPEKEITSTSIVQTSSSSSASSSSTVLPRHP